MYKHTIDGGGKEKGNRREHLVDKVRSNNIFKLLPIYLGM
jgi:hypothetical protein